MEYILLKDIAVITMGQSPDSSTYNQEKQGLPFYQGNADFGEIIPTTRIWCNSPKKVAKQNDILISVRAPIGSLNYANEVCCIGRGLAAISIEDDIDRKFIYYFLKAKNRELNNQGTGSTFKAIGKSVLEELKIPTISKEKKLNSMKLMDSVERNIKLKKQELKMLDDLIKARFVEMFGDMTLNQNGWTETFLGEVCDVRDGTHDSPKYFDEGYPLVTSKNLNEGRINFKDCSLICEDDYNKINQRSKVDKGDILMPMIGTIGNPAIVDIETNFAIKNVALIKFKDNNKVCNSFVKALLKSDYFDKTVASKVKGGTQKFISLNDIRKLEICLPPINLQNQFADFVKQVDKSKFIQMNSTI